MEPRDVVPGPIIEPRWLDVDTAAQYLCMSRHALYHRVSRRQIPFVRRGRIVRFDRQALDRWMSKGERNGFGEAGRDLVLHETNQRPAVSRVHRVRRQEIRQRRAVEIEHDIRAGVHGWKSTIPSFAEWWAVYRETYTPLKSARNRDAQIVAHFLPHLGAKPLDEITKSDIVRYMNYRRTQMTGNPGHKNRRVVSESTVRRERGLLQLVCRVPVRDGSKIGIPFAHPPLEPPDTVGNDMLRNPPYRPVM